ncbi:hypothetical protein J5N97_019844 [Dioscorea zingiberensis]|uniref:Uncharacterized protein n=1 Tax=Dioscorea zingiberensis TaxID=325984 RepID=A0A9D5CFD9_9LILI|nr:hypothetical protein J5N97_019844 [Dioscorea zingiberensis]
MDKMLGHLRRRWSCRRSGSSDREMESGAGYSRIVRCNDPEIQGVVAAGRHLFLLGGRLCALQSLGGLSSCEYLVAACRCWSDDGEGNRRRLALKKQGLRGMMYSEDTRS